MLSVICVQFDFNILQKTSNHHLIEYQIQIKGFEIPPTQKRNSFCYCTYGMETLSGACMWVDPLENLSTQFFSVLYWHLCYMDDSICVYTFLGHIISSVIFLRYGTALVFHGNSCCKIELKLYSTNNLRNLESYLLCSIGNKQLKPVFFLANTCLVKSIINS